MELLDEAADRIDLGDAYQVAKLRPHDPILKRAQISGGPFCAVGLLRPDLGLYRVHENLAEPGGDGPHFRFKPLRKLIFDLLQSLVD